MSKEAMQQALDALALAKSSHNMVLTSDPPQSAWRYYNVDMKLQDAITALRQALDQQSECVTTIDIHPDLVAALNEQQQSIALCQALEQAAAWVGLTDEEIKALANWWPSYDQMPALKVLIKDVINSLKEKNT